MKRRHGDTINRRGGARKRPSLHPMDRRQVCYYIGIGFILLLCSALSAGGEKRHKDYTRLVELIRLEDRAAPLVAFSGFKTEMEAESHAGFLGYLNDHPDMVKRIQNNLGGKEIGWRLNNLHHRLMFVPEKRKEYAVIFESYCKDVVDYLLDRTRLPNPYHAIRTLDQEIPEPAAKGVTAFLVHNLAKESIAEYIFSNAKNKKVKIRLKGMKFIGRVGAYTTTISQETDGGFKFERDRFTIWQNSAKNPYTALMAPMEETLHILLRGSTEKGIKDQLDRFRTKRLKEVKKIAADWIRVEEAIVGGLVYQLLPLFLQTHVHHFPDQLIEKDIDSKTKLKQYTHLRKGIRTVEKLGCQQSIQIYQEDPKKFKKYLLESKSV